METTVLIPDYPEYQKYDINLPECGLTFVPTIHNYTFDRLCYKDKYIPKTLYDFQGNNLMFEKVEKDATQERIYMGKELEYGEAPWTVQVFAEFETGESKLICTGSLIAFNWVITSAHCFGYELSFE